LDGDETILARNIIGTGRNDIHYYLNKIKEEDDNSVAITGSMHTG
jgi:hypothetical protein